MRRRVTLGFVLVLVLALVGCGSKKSSAPPPQTTTAASPTTTAASPTTTAAAATTTTSSSSSGKPSFASTKNCAQLASVASKIASSVNPSGDPATALKNEENVFDALEAAAPDAIKADFKTLGDAFKTFAEAYAGAGIKAGVVPSAAQLAKLGTAEKALNNPKLKAAEQHLTAWGQKNCNFSSTNP